jgi:Cu/Ag efflux pump CusA
MFIFRRFMAERSIAYVVGFLTIVGTALTLSTLGTKYLNQLFIISREVRDRATDAIVVTADYSELGVLLITVTAISLLLPMATILSIQNFP